MKKKKFLKLALKFAVSACALFIVYIALVIGATEFGPLSKYHWPQTVEKAETVAVNYFKSEKNVDVVITNTGFSGELLASDVYIEGHIKGNKQKTVSATIESRDSYKVKKAIIGD
ncbi:hypothetical protein LQV63_08880 [Paenibacillus profundus]|uniref:Uncharacterized protein n=1 Tax=Paenibacillus profundus TaxID=1173085 RepID=A0ABS8YDV1_9BACL|nr:hypothetical protein [Paenibacillus profundus]MCE5169424.1 hypothetical protein [Paenibacillus profundus]